MKKYMVITRTDDGSAFAAFFDTYDEADGFKMDGECGMGYYAEVYERDDVHGYRLLYC